MIPKIHRLIINNTTPFIGKKTVGTWATYITKTSSELRWSIRISKQIYPLAVDRNARRRQLNHWLYRERSRLIGQEFLIILRRPLLTDADYYSLLDECESHLFFKAAI